VPGSAPSANAATAAARAMRNISFLPSICERTPAPAAREPGKASGTRGAGLAGAFEAEEAICGSGRADGRLQAPVRVEAGRTHRRGKRDRRRRGTCRRVVGGRLRSARDVALSGGRGGVCAGDLHAPRGAVGAVAADSRRPGRPGPQRVPARRGRRPAPGGPAGVPAMSPDGTWRVAAGRAMRSHRRCSGRGHRGRDTAHGAAGAVHGGRDAAHDRPDDPGRAPHDGALGHGTDGRDGATHLRCDGPHDRRTHLRRHRGVSV
jgi:hypothetical protein